MIHIDVTKTLLSSEGAMALEVKADISPGSLTAVFGPSGAGKTTVLRMLAGLTNPDHGVIQFGKTVWFDSKRGINVTPQARRIGMMFQDYALFPAMTVEQNIHFAQEGNDRSFTRSLLAKMQLTEFADRKPGQLSGGQKQRVALARVLARRPRVLLLDEPLSALDAGMRAMLQDEISQAHQMSGATTLMVSHDLSEVFRLAHYVLCIEQGKLTAAGVPQAVFSDTTISGKFQISGKITTIEKQDVVYVVTVITGNNSMVKVIAFEDDIANLAAGDRVLLASKAFNPLIKKL